MTSLSRRKRPTILPNILRWNQPSRLAAGLLFGFFVVSSSTRADERILPTMGWKATEVADSDAPIERLRTRSSSDRWKAASERMKSESRVGSAEQQRYVTPAAEETTPVRRNVTPVEMPVVPPAVPAEAAIDELLNNVPEAEPGLAPAPMTRPVPRIAQNPAPPVPAPDRKFAEPVKNPRELRKITEIMPYYDYEPDPEVSKDDPCLYRCPRPADGCKKYPPGETPACPEEVKLSEELYAGRTMPENLFGWEASNLWHNPLYFEDFALERYGHTHHCLVQPFASVGKFGVQLLGWPYQATIDPPCKRVYTLGWYRPGECAPKKCYQIPWNTEAAAVQAGVWAGGIAIFP